MKVSELRDACNKILEEYGDLYIYDLTDDNAMGDRIWAFDVRNLETNPSNYVEFMTDKDEKLIVVLR